MDLGDFLARLLVGGGCLGCLLWLLSFTIFMIYGGYLVLKHLGGC